MKRYRIRKGSIADKAVNIGRVLLVSVVGAIALFGPIVWHMQSTHPFL